MYIVIFVVGTSPTSVHLSPLDRRHQGQWIHLFPLGPRGAGVTVSLNLLGKDQKGKPKKNGKMGIAWDFLKLI